MSNDIVPSISITNLVNQRTACMQRLEQAVALIREAATIAASAGLGMPRFTVGTGYSYRNSDTTINDALLGADKNGARFARAANAVDEVSKQIRLGVDCGGWQYLMTQSGLRSLMDATAREKWDKSIMDGDVPELNEANIRSTFGMLHDSRADMFERGVLACFKGLAWDYKTNLPQKFGKRIVVTSLTGYWSDRRHNELDDLMRVFHVLDGKPEPDCRGGIWQLLNSAGLSSFSAGHGTAENEYLHIRVFKNRNGHITFKRPDLVDQMNRILAKHYPNALPEPKTGVRGAGRGGG